MRIKRFFHFIYDQICSFSKKKIYIYIYIRADIRDYFRNQITVR